MSKRRVVVLGSGKIGRMVGFLMQTCGDYEVVMVDGDGAMAESAAALAPGATSMVAKLDNAGEVRRAVQGSWAALSCAPFFCNPIIAKECRDVGVHYLDLTEDVAVTKQVKELSNGARTAFAPQCGLAPGFITIAGYDLARPLEPLHDLRLRVGALPRFPSNRLNYNMTWSTHGLINEYCNPCEAVEDGTFVTVPPLEQLEHLKIDGVTYEAFNTSGGVGTLAESLHGRVRNLNYKTMRFPGHCDHLKLLLHDLRFIDRRDELCDIFDRAIPTTKQDQVVIFCCATGMMEGRFTERTYAKTVLHQEIGGKHWTAIQITTAAGICAIADLMAEGRLPASGFIRMEDVGLEAFLANRFGRYYA